MTVKKTHWLHGDVEFAVAVSVETSCSTCVHRNVCARDNQKRCANFDQSNSDRAGGCQTCIHRYTRWAGERAGQDTSIPCFLCREYLAGIAECKDPQKGGA